VAGRSGGSCSAACARVTCFCLRRLKFVASADSRRDLPLHHNLAQGLTLRAVDRLWIADITYVRLKAEFLYLAVIPVAFSQCVIGWALVKCALKGGRCHSPRHPVESVRKAACRQLRRP
jgi:transposase InsO family protein